MSFKKTLCRIQISQFNSLASVRTTWYSIRTLFSQQHPSERRVIPSGLPFVLNANRPDYVSYHLDAHLSKASSVRTFSCVEKFQTVPACICSDVSAAHPDDSQCSTSFRILPKHSYGKIAATVQTTWIPVRTRSSIRQVSQFKSRHPDDGPHGPDARASDMEIVCIKSIVWTIIPMVRTREAFIWKLLTAEVRPSGWQGTTVWTRLKNKKEFQRNSRTIDRIVVHPNGPLLLSGRRLVFIKPNAHLNCQPINRGP
jgi:hypothetical protein